MPVQKYNLQVHRPRLWWWVVAVRWAMFFAEQSLVVGLTLYYVKVNDLGGIARLTAAAGLCRMTRLPISYMADRSRCSKPSARMIFILMVILAVIAVFTFGPFNDALWLNAAFCMVIHSILNPILSRVGFLLIAKNPRFVMSCNAIYRAIRTVIGIATPLCCALTMAYTGETFFISVNIVVCLLSLVFLYRLKSDRESASLYQGNSSDLDPKKLIRILLQSKVMVPMLTALLIGFFESARTMVIASLFACVWSDYSFSSFLTVVVGSAVILPSILRIPGMGNPCPHNFALGYMVNGIALGIMVIWGPFPVAVFIYGLAFAYGRVSHGSLIKTSVPAFIATTVEASRDAVKGLGVICGSITVAPLIQYLENDVSGLVCLAGSTAAIQASLFAVLVVILLIRNKMDLA